MPDTTNDINALLEFLQLASIGSYATIPGRVAADYRVAITALVAERNALRKRVAELEESTSILRWRVTTMLAEQPPAASEREKAMERWMDQVTAMLCHSMTHSHDAKQELVNRCDKAIDAMRRWDTNA